MVIRNQTFRRETLTTGTGITEHKIIMGDIEQGKCEFCQEIKPIQRTYLYPSKYERNPNDISGNKKKHNEGAYFIIISTCNDCGVPKLTKQTNRGTAEPTKQ